MPSYVTSRTLAVRLTPEEIIAASKDLTKHLNDLDQLENQLENFKKTHKAEAGKVEAMIQGERIRISTGEDFREVECETSINVKDHTKTVTRTDTGEIVDETKLTSEDLQYQLQFAKKENEKDG